MKCIYCNSENMINAKYCSNCGSEIGFSIDKTETVSSSKQFARIKDYNVKAYFACRIYRRAAGYQYGHHGTSHGGYYPGTTYQQGYIGVNGDAIYLDYLDGNVDSFPKTAITKNKIGMATTIPIGFLVLFMVIVGTMVTAISQFNTAMMIIPILMGGFAVMSILPIALLPLKSLTINTKSGVIYVRFNNTNEKKQFLRAINQYQHGVSKY